MEEAIKCILENIIDNPGISKKINRNTNLATEIGLDSLKMINFFLKIEDELNIYIDFDKFSYDDLTSIDRFTRFLEQCEKADLTV